MNELSYKHTFVHFHTVGAYLSTYFERCLFYDLIVLFISLLVFKKGDQTK